MLSMLWKWKPLGVALAMLCLCGLPVVLHAQEEEASPEEEYSAVRVRLAPVRGRVFLSSEKEDSGDIPGADVRVQVRDIATDELLAETFTDKNGTYELPEFDIGRYYMHVGALRLELLVVPESVAGEELPKIIILIIPEEMAYVDIYGE